MDLDLKIKEDLRSALKSKETEKLSVLRMLASSMKNKQIEKKKRDKLSDKEIQEVVFKEVKQRKDSISEYKKGNREDLAQKEQKEIEILNGYLSKQMSNADILNAVEKAIKSTSASSPSDMGKVMSKLMPEVKGKADGAVVSKIVKEKLS